MVLLSFLTLLVSSQVATAGGTIAGHVLERGTNQPIADARVMLMSQAPGLPFTPPRETLSDRDGRYVFDGVAPGAYRITVQKAGYAALDPFVRPALITIAAGQIVSNVDQLLQRGGVIAGRVVDESGRPVIDARVSAFRRPPNSRDQARLVPAGPGTQTNDLGEFRVHSLPPGEYYVQAAPRPDAPFGNASPRPTTMAPTFYPNTTDASTASPISLGEGQTVNDIFVTMLLLPAYEISGIVVDENGQPVAGAMIVLRDQGSGVLPMGPRERARTNAFGQFTIPNVTNGTYFINAAAPMVTVAPIPQGGSISTTIGAGTVSGSIGGVASGGWSMSETRGGTTVQYRADAGTQVPVTVNGASVTGLQIIATRPR